MNLKNSVVDAGGITTHLIEAGAGEPLILIHGGGAGADALGNWEKIMPAYAAAGFRTIAYDLVGFGRSAAPDPDEFLYDQASRNIQLLGLLDALKIERASIIGNSMGGATALGLAMMAPERVNKLVLMASAGVNRNTSAGLAPLVNYDSTLEGMRKIVAALTNPKFVINEDMVRYRFERFSDPAVKKAYSAIMGWVKAQGGLHYDEDQIASLKHQALVITGKNDQVIPMEESITLMKLIENSHGYFIPNCGHWAMMEYPDLFAEVTIAYLKRSIEVA
jgi:2-hydroxy-6-oxo-6-(2'-aminophenyl)hexa-2,4-dienoate hydrolase